MGLKSDNKNFVNERYVKALHRVFEIVALRVQKQWLILDVIFNRSNLKKELDESLKIIHETSTKVWIKGRWLMYFPTMAVSLSDLQVLRSLKVIWGVGRGTVKHNNNKHFATKSPYEAVWKPITSYINTNWCFTSPFEAFVSLVCVEKRPEFIFHTQYRVIPGYTSLPLETKTRLIILSILNLLIKIEKRTTPTFQKLESALWSNFALFWFLFLFLFLDGSNQNIGTFRTISKGWNKRKWYVRHLSSKLKFHNQKYIAQISNHVHFRYRGNSQFSPYFNREQYNSRRQYLHGSSAQVFVWQRPACRVWHQR